MEASRWTLFPLRLVIGFGFAAHGLAKFSRGPDVFAAALGSLGVPAPSLMAWLTASVELLGGGFIMAGAFVAPVSLPLAIVMLVAMFKVHLQYGFSSIKLQEVIASGPVFGKPGYEVCLLYLVGLLTIVLGGPGAFAVDGWLKTKANQPL